MRRDKEVYIEEGRQPATASQIFRLELDALVPNPAKVELSPMKEPPAFFNLVVQPSKMQHKVLEDELFP